VEHGLASAYADFMPALNDSASPMTPVSESTPSLSIPAVPESAAIPVTDKRAYDPNNPKMTNMVIIFNQSKFETLKSAMNAIGITGITVSQVLGCGMQKGHKEFYRGVPMDINLLPKVKVEIVICKVPVREAIEAAKKALYTGNIGDGKIFLYDVENVVKVRTGEEGYDALQDD